MGMATLDIKSNSNVKEIEISPTNLCSSFLFKNNKNIRLNCSETFNYNGYCTNSFGEIDNCLFMNKIYECEICYKGYESNVTYCNECLSNCLRCYNNECINCEMNYQLNQTIQCELIINDLDELFDNSKTIKCNDGYYSSNKNIQCSSLLKIKRFWTFKKY